MSILGWLREVTDPQDVVKSRGIQWGGQKLLRTKRSDLPVELVKPAGRIPKRSSKWGGGAAWVEIASIAARTKDFMIAGA